METSMLPPPIPRYFLRVKLFSPTAYSLNDEPVRSFRVVADPSNTVHEFCQEASRRHESSYGGTLLIKKCTDDQLFDITQNDVIGALFASGDTLRIIQSSAYPSPRDSVPPESALRFNHKSIIGHKRGREISPKTNGFSHAGSFESNKRQRLSSLDPDHPIPSHEERMEGEQQNGRIPDFIPNSQESVVLSDVGKLSKPRHVRTALPAIPETPSPPPSAATYSQSRSNADQYRQKNSNERTERQPSLDKQALDRGTAGGEDRSASTQQGASGYHIERYEGRGKSTSRAATTPSSTSQTPLVNGNVPDRRHNSDSSGSSRKQIKNIKHIQEDKDVFEISESDNDGVSRLNSKRRGSKDSRSPRAESTPSKTPRRSRDKSIPGELPLTPNSKQRQQQLTGQSDERRQAQIAAAAAAEQRQREAEEAKQAKQARAKREEQERFEVEEFKRNEAERIAREQRATKRQESEERRLVKEKKETEKAAKQKALAEKEAVRRDTEEKRIAQEKEEAKKLAEEQARSEELKGESEAQQKQLAQNQVKQQAQASRTNGRLTSSPSDSLRGNKPSSSPELPRARATSGSLASTAPIPGRKSALKNSNSGRSSSPAVSRTGSTPGVGIEDQMPLPKSARRVSFDTSLHEDAPKRLTNISTPQPTTPKILPPAKGVTPTPATLNSKTAILPPKPTYSRILPPNSNLKRSSSERSITPQSQKKPVTTKDPKQSHPVKDKPSPVPPPALSHGRGSNPPMSPSPEKVKPMVQNAEHPESSDLESEPKKTPKNQKKSALASRKATPAKPRASPPLELEDTEMNDAEEKTESEAQPVKSPIDTPMAEAPEEEEGADGENASVASSRDSRSPVIYSQHEVQQKSKSLEHSPSVESDQNSDSSSEESNSDEDEDENETIKINNVKEDTGDVQRGNDSSNSDSSDHEDNAVQDVVSSPVLPKNQPPTKQRTLNSFGHTNGKEETSKEQLPRSSDPSTQKQLDDQLTSSVYEASHRASSSPPPPPSSLPPRTKLGASLKAMNQNKRTFIKDVAKPAADPKDRRQLKLQQVGGDSDEESEEEESSDSDDSDVSLPVIPTPKVSSQPHRRQSQGEPDDLNNDSKQVSTTRAELMALINNASKGVLTPSLRPSSSMPASKTTNGLGKKTNYNSGYQFSQPR